MATKKQRLTISIVAVLVGLVALFLGNPLGWFGFVFAAPLMYGYFYYQPVALLLQHISQNRLADAEKVLAEIENPETLSVQERAYYDFALGWWALRRGELASAQKQIGQALSQGLRTSNDKALAHALLARAALQQKDDAQAAKELEQAKSFACKPLVAQEISAVEKELKLAHL